MAAKPKAAPRGEPDDLRKRLDKVLEEVVDDATLREAVSLAMQATKKAWGTCPKCAKQVQVDVSDAKAVVGALEILSNQAKGRPGVDEVGKGETIVFKRVIYLDRCAACPEGDGERDKGELIH